jgi:hypothetical protein
MFVYQVSRSLGTFDTILMMGGNLGLLGDHEKRRRLLDRFDRITTRDARIIGVGREPYDTDAPEHLAYHELNRRRGRPDRSECACGMSVTDHPGSTTFCLHETSYVRYSRTAHGGWTEPSIRRARPTLLLSRGRRPF